VLTIDRGCVAPARGAPSRGVGELTKLVSDNEVSARIPALGWPARRVARATVEKSMRRLKRFCECD
jgi:hypothetical protein